MHDKVVTRIRREKLIAIIRGIDVERCVKVADALYKGGIQLIEITFNQKDPSTFSDTAAAIRAIQERFQGNILAGAGTVLTCQQVDIAAESGAKYIISPDSNIDVIKHTRALGLVSIPGALTPSEITAAYHWGADFVKVFPVSNLGSTYIKALTAPISHIPLMAVGGVDESNLKSFLDAGCTGAGLGGRLVDKTIIENGEYEKITQTAKHLVEIAKGV